MRGERRSAKHGDVQLDLPSDDLAAIALDLAAPIILDEQTAITLDLPTIKLDLSEIVIDPLPDFKLDLSDIIRDLEKLPAIPSIDLDLQDIFGAPPPKRRKRPRRT
jgi:hypothetical protein